MGISEKPYSMNDVLQQDPEGAGKISAPNEKKNGIWLRFLIFFAGICLFAWILYATGWINIFFKKQQAKEFLESLGPAKFLGFIVLQASQVVLAPIPGEVTGFMGGYFFGVFWGVVLSTIGLTVGSFIAFILARIFGRPLVEKVVDARTLERFDYLLQRKGIFLVFMLFLLPGFPKDYLCFVLGLGHFTILEFLAVSTVGRLFGTVMLTLAGGYFSGAQYTKLAVLVAAAAAVIILAYLFRAKIEGFLKSLHAKKM